MVDSATDVPLPGASVRLTPLDSATEIEIVEADVAGEWSVCAVPPGERVVAIAEVGPRRSPSYEIVAGGVDRLTIRVPLTSEGTGESSLSTRTVAGNARVIGTVLDRQTGEPVSDAYVALEGVPGVGTDAQGSFLIRDPPPGLRRLSISRIGYDTLRTSVDIAADRTTSLRIELATRAIELEPLVVTTTHHPRLERHGFYERLAYSEKLGRGRLMTEEEIRATPASRVSDLLSRVQLVEMIRVCTPHCMNVPRLGRRTVWAYPPGARGGPELQPCPADVYVNGIRARLWHWNPYTRELVVNDDIDALAIPTELIGVEVYRRASELPAEFTGSGDGCGAVAIWTR